MSRSLRFLFASVLFVGAVLTSSIAHAHDIRMAVFDIYVEDGKVFCTVKADRVKSLTALDGKLSPEHVEAYFAQHLKVSFDGKPVSLQHKGQALTDHYINLTFELKGVTAAPSKVVVFTDYLMGQVTGQENRVILRLHGKSRSFRTTKQTTEIKADY